MNVPERIDLDSRAHTLTLHWPGARAQCVSHAAFRSCLLEVTGKLVINFHAMRSLPVGVPGSSA